MRRKLFIGIPCYQESDTLRRTLAFISGNTSQDHQLEVHASKQSVVNNKNEILKKAQLSGAEYICLCDDDIEPEVGWDAKLIRGIEEVESRTNHRVGQTAPMFLYPDNQVCFLWTNVLFDLANNCHYSRTMEPRVPVSDLFRVKLAVGAMSGTLSIFRRDFLDRVSWTFDNRYDKSQCEDVDQSLTCRSEGFVVLYNGTVAVKHYITGTNPRSTENYKKLLEKWRHRPDLSLVIPLDHEMIFRAQESLFASSDDPRRQFAKVLRFFRGNVIDRCLTGSNILRREGFQALIRQCYYKMNNGGLDDVSERVK